jgi:hypothetical protein
MDFVKSNSSLTVHATTGRGLPVWCRMPPQRQPGTSRGGQRGGGGLHSGGYRGVVLVGGPATTAVAAPGAVAERDSAFRASTPAEDSPHKR